MGVQFFKQIKCSAVSVNDVITDVQHHKSLEPGNTATVYRVILQTRVHAWS